MSKPANDTPPPPARRDRIRRQFREGERVPPARWQDDPFAITAPVDPAYRDAWEEDGSSRRTHYYYFQRLIARGMTRD